jgi:hypothetical protein
MNKNISFALMNVLIKGTAISIQNALAKLELNSFVLKEFTYNSKSVDASDSTIVKAGVVFEKWYEGFITPDEIPFASMTEIKFIGLGNGGDGYRSDGSYVFYKDFGESSVSECYQFSYISPHKEEFDAQWDVLDNVRNSFMDRAWQYRYEDYSCGEYCPWAFNSKKDKALILKWKSDEKDDSKKEAKQVTIGGMGDVAFAYEHIDGISPSFYDGIYDGKDFIVNPDAIVNVDINGKTFDVTIKTQKKMTSLLKKFKKSIAGKDIGRPLYCPTSVVSGNYEVCGSNEYGQAVYGVSDNAETLESVQIAHRASLFAKVNNLINDEKVLTCIIAAAPKKKNGTFALKRVTQIASLFCMEDDASMYVLCAVAKKDTELLIEVRQIATVDIEKTNSDVITISNLFRS